MSQDWQLPIDGATVGPGEALTDVIPGALESLRTCFAGTSAPTDTVAYMLWADTTNQRWKRRNAANTAWTDLGPLFARTGRQIMHARLGDLSATRTVRLASPSDGKVARVSLVSDTDSGASSDPGNDYTLQVSNISQGTTLFATAPANSTTPITASAAWSNDPDQNDAVLAGEVLEVVVTVVGAGDGLDAADVSVQVELEVQ